MVDKPDVVRQIAKVLENTYFGAKVEVTPTGISMVTPEADRFTIAVQRTSRLDAIIRAARDQ